MPLDTSSAKPAHRTGIVSRLAAPLASRNRNVTEFYVEPKDPWKAYFPGETVHGCVVLTVSKPVAITHLVLCLHGCARVYKNEVVPGDGSATSGFLGPGRGSRGTEYFGNGFVSLFEDESVLCGQGLLRIGIYQFKFEVAFPPRGLPSSLDFERGTVSYLLTATLTRPTTITPTLTCHRRILFQDAIDVGYITLPKPRVISLEPTSKRGKMKAKMRQKPLEEPLETPSPTSPVSVETGHARTSNRSMVERPPISPLSSAESSASAGTANSQSSKIIHHASSTSGASGQTSESKSTTTSTDEPAICASIQLLRPGVLPGDTVPLRVTVNHQKPNVRGLIIVTLYRRGSVDMYPVIPLISKGRGKGKGKGKSKQPEYEHIYPQSKTGLGALNFSTSAPSSVFRKDLCQTSAMMVIDPQTMTADVKTSLRIPEDVFPTMVNVPGGMIEFKYYVEIVLDLCGQLGESRLLPRISLTSPMQIFTATHGSESGTHLTDRWTDNILDTAQLRRGKNVVVTLFEIVVGSKDSTRTTKRGQDGTGGEHQPSRLHDMRDTDHTHIEDCQDEACEAQEEYGESCGDVAPRPGTRAPSLPLVPPPVLEEEGDEKTRLQRQEALLLPSQPPGNNDGRDPLPAARSAAPSAPFISKEECFNDSSGLRTREAGSILRNATLSASSLRSAETMTPPYSQPDLPRVNDHESFSAVTEDKQEMERQRLMAGTSAPPQIDPTETLEGASATAAQPSDADAPSAPTITEDDEYNAHTFTLNRDDQEIDELPRYRR